MSYLAGEKKGTQYFTRCMINKSFKEKLTGWQGLRKITGCVVVITTVFVVPLVSLNHEQLPMDFFMIDY